MFLSVSARLEHSIAFISTRFFQAANTTRAEGVFLNGPSVGEANCSFSFTLDQTLDMVRIDIGNYDHM